MKPVAMAAVCMVAAQIGSAQISFLRRDLSLTTHHPNGSAGMPRHLTVGDFNGDRLPDLVVTSLTGISVLLNTGNGKFAPPKQTLYGLPGPAIAADFNGDGRLDLLSAGLWRLDGDLLLGRGDRTFAAPRTLPGLGWPAAAGDFNRDGRIDVVCFDRGNTGFGALLGNGDGTFRRANQPPALFAPAALVTADFDRDGNPDVAGRGDLA